MQAQVSPTKSAVPLRLAATQQMIPHASQQPSKRLSKLTSKALDTDATSSKHVLDHTKMSGGYQATLNAITQNIQSH